MPSAAITVKIVANEKGLPLGKLADAELQFHTGPLAGLRLLGFAIWERRSGDGRNVTFPSRTYAVDGVRRSFSLLRPSPGNDAATAVQQPIIDLILAAYADYEQAASA
jgi:hypothetical protein